MKKAIFLLAAVVSMATVGCKTPPEKGGGYYWEIVRSPLTGRCYEVARAGNTGGMGEIPCLEAKFASK